MSTEPRTPEELQADMEACRLSHERWLKARRQRRLNFHDAAEEQAEDDYPDPSERMEYAREAADGHARGLTIDEWADDPHRGQADAINAGRF